MHPLLHLAVIWAAVFVAVVAAKKTRLTPVLFFLFMGFLLVNLGVLPAESDEFIRVFAELGIIFIMFALGFEESTDNFLASMKKSWGIALFGAIGPFAITYLIVDYIWQDANVSLMSALAMTATAVSLTMVSLRSAGLQNSVVATRVMTSAVIDDIGALVAVAIVVPLAVGGEALTVAAVTMTAGKAVLFFVLVTVIGGLVFPYPLRGWSKNVPFFGYFGFKHILTFDEGRHATLAVLLIALLVGLLANYFGFHYAVGAYMAGLIVNHDAIMLQRHGSVTVGESLVSAYHKLEKLEHTAEVLLAAHQLGGPKKLSQTEVVKLAKLREDMGLGVASDVLRACNPSGN